jgi:uncharacterized protein YbbK (DUF523 family)
MTNRWHNILGSFEWDRLRVDFEDAHKRAEEAGFDLKIFDEKCPHCGFYPVFEMKERREKKQGRAKQQPK